MPNDNDYFPVTESFLSHYVKMHLWHQLRANQEMYSDHLAWFGEEPVEGQAPAPFAILFNASLLSKTDRRIQLLLLCVPNNTDAYAED